MAENKVMPFPELKMAAWHAAINPYIKYDLSASSGQSSTINEILEWVDKDARTLWSDKNVLEYSSPMGMPQLRQEIALWHNVSAEQTLTFSGAVDAIFSICATLLSAADKVLVIQPGFEPLWAIPEALNCQVNKLKLDFTLENNWSLDLNKVEQALQTEPKLLIINFPNNPTGMTLPLDDYKKIIQMADEKGTWILSDEVFRGLEYQSVQQLPSMAALYQRGISISVMSKAFGLGGVRVGWAACQDQQFMKRLLNTKFYFSVCNGLTDEILATLALKAKKQILQRNLSIIRENLNELNQMMEMKPVIFDWQLPQTGCVAFPRVTHSAFHGQSKGEFCEQLAKKSGIKLLPGHLFATQNHHFRIGFGECCFKTNLKKMSEALKCF